MDKRSRRALLRYVALALAIGLLGACSRVQTVGERSRSNAFETAILTYTKLIRWGYFEEAARYVRARDDSPVPTDLQRISRYRVSSYNNANKLSADNGLEGRVLALIEYYEIDSGVLHTLRDEQAWWYDKEAKRWFLGSGLPAFGLYPE